MGVGERSSPKHLISHYPTHFPLSIYTIVVYIDTLWYIL
jgi:hypothetical protein